jgi:hypothetical protein
MGETPESNGRIKLTWPQIVAFIGWFAVALLAYGAMDSRVNVIDSREQQHYEEIQRTLQRIERGVERLQGQ